MSLVLSPAELYRKLQARMLLLSKPSNRHVDLEAGDDGPSSADRERDLLLRAASVGDTSNLSPQALRDHVFATTAMGNTCLHLAAMGGHQEFVKLVVGYKPEREFLHHANRNGETPLILAAASKNKEFAFRISMFIIEAGNPHDPILLRSDRNGDNAVHHALKNGNRNLAKALINFNREVSKQVNKSNESLMYLAIRRGYVDIVEDLMQIDESRQDGPCGTTVLKTAILGGYTDIALKLLAERQKGGRNPEDESALIYAIRCNDLRMTHIILKKYPSFGSINSSDGLSPFLIAAEEDAVDIAEEIIFYCTIDAAFYCDDKGRSALHVAVDKGHTNFVKFIVNHPGLSRLVHCADESGQTALHLAAVKCKPSIIRVLLANQQGEHFLMNEGHAAMDFAYYASRQNKGEHKLDKYFPVDKKGYTALDLAYYTSQHMGEFKWGEVVDLLSDARCPLTAPFEVRANAKQNFINGIRKHADQVTSSYRNSTSTVGILITTVTFAAAFTLPGGYFQDPGPKQGLPVFSRKAAFQAFLISDTLAMCASLMSAFMCNMYRVSDLDFVLHYANKIRYLMWFAYATTAVAFATGLYTVLVPTQLWLSILVCVPCCIVPFLSYFLLERRILKVSRQQHRALMINFDEVL